ncbi:MAG: hypothetical protein A3G21_18875 [Acidobacteria bacterium RIFCSPLOWO2_12_FULL_66_21]|nr:MAG: hypothetical protein A3G21_18875 [Acidobacteria bacterium RIFCSPLOWO2_12_FULL_66_21]
MSERPQDIHVSSTCFPQRRRSIVVAALALTLVVASPGVSRSAETTLYRLFLLDGSTLVSYGEFARVADRVVFSVPIGETSDANLQVISIAESAVDWERTDRYTDAVRAKHYAETRGADDFAMLSNRVVEALNTIAVTENPARRLAMAQEARANLARWPSENFGYRAKDVAQMVGMLDEVVSDLGPAAGKSQFELSLVGITEPPAVELLPDPGLRERLERGLAAAELASEPSERLSLLQAIALSLREPAKAGGWAAALERRASAALETELKLARSYADLTRSIVTLAKARAARADVRGVQAVIQQALAADDRLGRRRPGEMAGLLAVLDLRLDEARRLRLARDAWAARRVLFDHYRGAIDSILATVRRGKKPLEQIRELAGPAPGTLERLEQRFVMARQALQRVETPAELQSSRDLFAAGLLMAGRAASTRRNAVSSRNMKLAWDAAAAASGALMLIDRARDELDRLTTRPPDR